MEIVFEAGIPLADCYAEAFQRPINEVFVKREAKRVDELLLQTVTFAATDNGNSWLDGQHRGAILRLAGRTEVPRALVVYGLSYEERALKFVELQMQRRAVKPYERYVAKREGRDPATCALDDAVRRAGFTVAEWDGPNKIRAVSTLERVFRQSSVLTGALLIERLLRLIGRWPVDTRRRVDSDLLIALGWVLGNYPALDDDVMALVLMEWWPENLLNWAVQWWGRPSSRGGRGVSTGVVYKLIVEYNKRVPKGVRLPAPKNPRDLRLVA